MIDFKINWLNVLVSLICQSIKKNVLELLYVISIHFVVSFCNHNTKSIWIVLVLDIIHYKATHYFCAAVGCDGQTGYYLATSCNYREKVWKTYITCSCYCSRCFFCFLCWTKVYTQMVQLHAAEFLNPPLNLFDTIYIDFI